MDEPGMPVTPKRKAEHLRINLEEDVTARGVRSGFERYRFIPRALPDVDFTSVSITTEIFGHQLNAPLLISCMTGGVSEAQIINTRLARTAQRFGLALGLGSARVLLEQPEVLPTFDVRPFAPDVLIFANLGAIQLNRGVTVTQCHQLVEMLSADALVLHLNALQEALQPEGDTDFAGLLPRIESLCRQIEVPVIAKEVGWGIPADDARRLLDAGVAAIDVAGAGGTSWSEVERYRMTDPVRQQIAAAFADWGLPTADALVQARQAAPKATIFASGGLRDGMDIAKALGLGADLAGIAGPFLRAAAGGQDACDAFAAALTGVLRTVMFATGAQDLAAFKANPRLAEVGPMGAALTPGPSPNRSGRGGS